ncbi:hypothetical protein DFQ28_011309 [Apophysomyces sp. BC1034]|nr:hypothetical protein DFQ29_009745 [Apophysomyces sp. BC1021]KAG0184371.1 hypothetical protein DFQ28_011309 [Apophysomyces sp. BC1034]
MAALSVAISRPRKVILPNQFEDPRDAEDAFQEMHGRRIDGYTISVQWARNAPSASWRYDRSPRRRRSPSPRRPARRVSYGRSHSRSRSPPFRGGRSPSPRGRSPPPPGFERRFESRSRSPPRQPDERYPAEPVRDSRSRSPVAEVRRDSRSPSPKEKRSPSPRSGSPEH